VHAPLQIPAFAVLHGSGAEVKVDKLTHFAQLTRGQAAAGPGRFTGSPARGAGHPQRARSRRAQNKAVIDKSALLRMSQAERRELASLLTALDEPAQAGTAGAEPDPDRADPFNVDPVLRRERRLALVIAAACCVFLAGWIVVLAATLPHHFDAHHWRAVWVNFDVFLLAAFAATAWAIWRERQVLILLLMFTGTMLCCDAWFDVGTSLATSGFGISLLSAVVAELPLAFLAFAGARQLLRATVVAGILAGASAQASTAQASTVQASTAQASTAQASCSLCRTALAGSGLDEALPRRMAK